MSLKKYTIVVAHREASHREVWSPVKPGRGRQGVLDRVMYVG